MALHLLTRFIPVKNSFTSKEGYPTMVALFIAFKAVYKAVELRFSISSSTSDFR